MIPAVESETLVGVDLAIEAVVEREDVKRSVFGELAEFNLGGHFSGGKNSKGRSKEGGEGHLEDEKPSGAGVIGAPEGDGVHRSRSVAIFVWRFNRSS